MDRKGRGTTGELDINGDEYDEGDVGEQGGTRHDTAAESPRSCIMLDLGIVKCNGLLDLAPSHSPRLGGPPH